MSKLVKIVLCAIIKAREILDVWYRQLSPHKLSCEEEAARPCGLFLFYKLITYIQE